MWPRTARSPTGQDAATDRSRRLEEIRTPKTGTLASGTQAAARGERGAANPATIARSITKPSTKLSSRHMGFQMADRPPSLDGLLSCPRRSRAARGPGELAKGPAPVSELTKPSRMAMPSFLKHLQLLDQRLIRATKSGRQRTCRLNPPGALRPSSPCSTISDTTRASRASPCAGAPRWTGNESSSTWPTTARHWPTRSTKGSGWGSRNGATPNGRRMHRPSRSTEPRHGAGAALSRVILHPQRWSLAAGADNSASEASAQQIGRRPHAESDRERGDAARELDYAC